jgi:nucleoside-diphosphate-sugar epimerase
LKKALVLGGGGFIGGHLVKSLVSKGYWVRSVDLKDHLYGANPQEFMKGDLTDQSFSESVLRLPKNGIFDEIYQLAADMGGAGYIFSGENDANVMHNSATINLNFLDNLVKNQSASKLGSTKIFYSSSACIYPEERQLNPNNPGLKETDAYPANPDSEYGWEKLFSERLYLAYARNYGISVRIARFHNIFGPEGTWHGGREKAPAAICRKVAQVQPGGYIEIWGDGQQTRSFLYIDECLEGIRRLMASEMQQPINIGSEEMVSINELVRLAASFENKNFEIRHISGPQGVRGRNSNNELFRASLKWNFTMKLDEGLKRTYFWIKEQLMMKESESNRIHNRVLN